MAKDNQDSGINRRSFLNDAVIASAAVAAGTKMAAVADAAAEGAKPTAKPAAGIHTGNRQRHRLHEKKARGGATCFFIRYLLLVERSDV